MAPNARPGRRYHLCISRQCLRRRRGQNQPRRHPPAAWSRERAEPLAVKLHFEPNLDYQLQAVEAVCGLFRGQETCRTEFTVTRDAASGQMALFENDLGIGNRLTLLDDELLANLHAIQLRHGLAPS